MKLKFVIIISLLVLSHTTMAEQGCPSGQIPYTADGSISSCGPIPTENNRPQAPRPSGKWIKTWGSIALDTGESGNIGVSVGALSKKEAEKNAVHECATTGGFDCRVLLAYRNQCAAIAEPIRDGNPIAGSISATGSATVEQAKDMAIQRCSKINNSNCRVIYSACSEPIFQAF